MDVILHLGAHCTATASLQDYLHRHADVLAERQIGYAGPPRRRWRDNVGGAYGSVQRAVSNEKECGVSLDMNRFASKGMKKLIVSDANMIGTLHENIKQGALYPDIRARMSKVADACDAQVSTILFSIRNLENYWSSVLAHSVAQGCPIPERHDLTQIAFSRRGWREVISEIAEVLPKARLRILPFEQYAGRPEVLLANGAKIGVPFDHERCWLNRAPSLPELRRVLSDTPTALSRLPFGMGRWNLFNNEEHAALREKHADDLMWLTAGADGLATLTEDCHRVRVGHTPPLEQSEKGPSDELEERQLARPG